MVKTYYAQRVASRIREARTRKGWKQSALAEATGLSITSISDIERGSRTLGPELLARIAEALGVTLEYLLDLASARDTSVDYNKKDILGVPIDDLQDAYHISWDETLTPEPGDIVVVKHNNELSLKRYDPLSPNTQIIGVVIQITRRLR